MWIGGVFVSFLALIVLLSGEGFLIIAVFVVPLEFIGMLFLSQMALGNRMHQGLILIAFCLAALAYYADLRDVVDRNNFILSYFRFLSIRSIYKLLRIEPVLFEFSFFFVPLIYMFIYLTGGFVVNFALDRKTPHTRSE